MRHGAEGLIIGKALHAEHIVVENAVKAQVSEAEFLMRQPDVLAHIGAVHLKGVVVPHPELPGKVGRRRLCIFIDENIHTHLLTLQQYFYDLLHAVLQRPFGNLAPFSGGMDLFEQLFIPGRQEVCSRINRTNGVRRIAGTPVCHDKSVKTPSLSQQIMQKRRALTRVDAVDGVIARHHAGWLVE